jgi:Xaa-Pro dipeptidase
MHARHGRPPRPDAVHRVRVRIAESGIERRIGSEHLIFVGHRAILPPKADRRNKPSYNGDDMESLDLESLYRAHAQIVLRRTAAALQQNGWDALAIHSGSPQKRTNVDDNYWPLRPTPEFQHWAPLSEPGCAIIVESGKKPKLVRLLSTSFWEDPAPPECDWFWSSFEVVELRDPAAVREHVPRGRVAFLGDDLEAAAAWGIAPEATNPPKLVADLDQLRTLKTPYEVACLAEANRRAAVGHEELRRLFHDAERSELDLHLAFLGATKQDDAETPYKNIVALDKHAATLHHVSYSKRAQPAQSLLLDAGATFAGYASDVTRTWVKGRGASASTFGQLVALTEAMQQRLCAAVRTGIPYEELHEESHRQVGGILREVGIVKTSAQDVAANGVTRAFYPHGLGHALGLQVHDVGCALVPPRPENSFLRNTTVVAPDQVFTIEPGIYFIESLLAPLRQGARASDIDWKVVDALAPFGGVRIEDDVVVREKGVRNLTREQLGSSGRPTSAS